jgi:hypothetical protein
MAGSSQFKVPHTDTDSNAFVPVTNLPAHLVKYEKIAEDLRKHMTPVMRLALNLTDKTALRSAALPQPE